MADFATLIMSAETAGLMRGVKALQDVTKEGGKAEGATKGVSGGFDKAGAAANRATAPMVRANTQMKGMAVFARRAAVALTGMAAGYAGIQGASRAIAVAKDFNAAIAETSTLIKGTPQEIDALTKGAINLTKAYGGTATKQIKAYYQAISAGADGVSGATKILDQANKLAIGGVTDVTTGVDALTTAVNAYAAQGLTAAQASDALFVGMKAGKTTVGELGASLGQVIPIAAAAGVSFDEVVAGVSALTTQGQTTAMATTGLRQVIASVVKPTKEASDMAKQLGISFNAQALEADGLAAFLADIIEKTGGNTDAMAQLFGSVEALNAALAFAGGAGEKFTGIMTGMADKAGATDAAFQKVSESLNQRLNKALGELGTIGLQAGNALLTVFVPAVEGAVVAAQFLADNVDILVISMAGLAGTQIPNLIASIGTLVSISGKAAVALRALGVAAWAATGPWGILAGLVAAAGAAYVVFSDKTKTFQTTMGELDKAQETLNTQVAAFATTYAPAAGKAAIDAANDYLQAAKAAREFAAAQLASDTAESSRIQGMINNGHLRTLTMEEQAKISARLHGVQSRMTMSEKAYEEALKARDETVVFVMSHDDEMAGGMKKLNSEITITTKGLGGTGKAAKEAAEKIKSFTETLKDAALTAAEFGAEKANIMIGGIDSLSDAWGQFVVDGFSNFHDFTDAIVGSFKNMLAQMIALSAKNQIMIALGIGGAGVGGSAVAGAVGGGGGGLLGSLLGLGNLGSGLMGGTGILGGIGTGLGGILSGGGLGASFANLGGLLTGASSGLGALGAAIPALGVVAGGIALLIKGLSQKYAGTALRGTIDTSGFDGRSFDFYRGGFLRGNKEVNKDVPEELALYLDQAMMGVVGGIETYADTLELNTRKAFKVAGEEFTIWLSDLDDQGIIDALNSEVKAVADEMAALVLGTDKFTRSGESAMETLTRLGQGLAAVNDAADILGHRMWAVSLRSADAASELVELFGGLDAMTAAVGVYWQAFYTEAERTETTVRRLRETFADLGVVMPESRSAYRDLVEGLDTTTEKGRELYAALIGMAGAMDEVLPQVADFTIAMSGLIGSIGGEVGSLIEAAKTNARITEQSAALWYRTATTLRGFLSDLLNTDLTAASGSQQAARNRARFNTAFEMARGGDVEAARDIPGLANAYLNSARATASTSMEYRRIASQVQGQVNFLAGISELEGANQDVLTTLYEKQIEVLTSLGNFLQQLEGLTGDDLASLDAGVQDLVKNWDQTTADFETVLGGLEAAIIDAQNFSYDKLLSDLDVAISLADRTNLPDWLVKVVNAAGDDILTTLDFIIRRNDITPDMRWIAVNAVSEHIKTVDFVVRNDLTKAQAELALSAGGELRRNIVLTLTRDVDDQTRLIALAGSSELSRVVNVALDTIGSDDRALILALRNVHDYAVNVTAAFGPDVPGRLRNMLLRQSGPYAAMIEASVTELEGDERRILLRQQGKYTAKIGAILNDKMPRWKRILLANEATDAVRKVTLKVFDGDLTDRQRMLMDAITGATRGTITLGGTFRFAPEDAFSVWYETTTQSLIATPMGKLGKMLGDLRDTVAAETISREAAMIAVDGLAAKSALDEGRADRRTTADELRAIFSGAGVTSLGKGITVQDGKLTADGYWSGTVAAFEQVMADLRSAFGVTGGTIAELTSKIFTDVNDPVATAKDQLAALRTMYRDLTGEAPSFAGGGYTGDGARSGGIDGKGGFRAILHPRETVVDHTKGDLSELLREILRENMRLRSEVAGMRDEEAAANRVKVKRLNNLSDNSDRQDLVVDKLDQITNSTTGILTRTT